MKCDSCGNIGCDGRDCANSGKENDSHRCKLCGSFNFSAAGG